MCVCDVGGDLKRYQRDVKSGQHPKPRIGSTEIGFQGVHGRVWGACGVHELSELIVWGDMFEEGWRRVGPM